MSQTVSSMTVAEHLLSLRDDTPTTPMSLVKLVYLAHGWTLGFTGQPLLGEEVVAGRFGPVIKSLEDKYEIFGSEPILPSIQGAKAVDRSSELGQEFSEIIESVNKRYGNFSDIELSDLTHLAETPWSEAYKNGDGTVVSNETIRNYYHDLIQEITVESQHADSR